MALSEQFKGELAMLRKAPLTFFVGFVVLGALIGWAEYSFVFKEIIFLKDERIKTLEQDTRTSQPSPTGAATATGKGNTANSGNGSTVNGQPSGNGK